jgi:hypothetical protein
MAEVLWHNEPEGPGENDATLSIAAVQVVTKVEHRNT